MGNYTKTFGTGVIPTFNITPGQGNTSWKYGGDESAAILDEYLAERALAKAEQEDTFTNKTIPSIKKLLFPEADDVESGIADMVVDEIVNPDRMTDEETGKFSGSPSAATDAILEENAFDGDKPDSWLDMGIDKFKGLFGNYDEDSPLAFNYEDGGRVGFMDGGMGFKDVVERFAEGLTDREFIEFEMMSPEQQMEIMKRAGVMRDDMNTGGRVGLKDGANESFYVNDRPVSEEVYDLKGRQMDLNMTGQEAFKQMTEQFSDVAPEQIMDIIEDKFPQYMEDPTDPFAGMAYGGRVGLQAGGMPFTPFMDPTYATQYYNQNFNAPQQAVPVPNVPGEGEDRGFSKIRTLPVDPGFIEKDFGTLSGPVKGGGDNRPVSRFEANPTTMGFDDEGKMVYTSVNPYTKNVKVGDEVPFVSPLAYGLGYIADKTTKFLEKTFVPESVKAYFSKEDAAPMTPTKRPDTTTASPSVAESLTSGPVTPGQSMAMVGNTSLAGMSQAQAQQAMEQGFSTGYDEGQIDPGFAKALQDRAADDPGYEVGYGIGKVDPGFAAALQSADTKSEKSTNLGTGTYSDGVVSGYTGGPQSPHSSMSTANNKIGNVKGEPFGGFTANQLSKSNLVGYGFNPETGKYKGAVQTKHGPLVSNPAKNKKLQALAKKFGKNYGGGGGGGGGAGGGGGKGCFVKGTMIEMADGTEKEITTIAVGELTKGGVVEAKLEFMPTQIYNYKGVEVSGSHLVMENNQFIKVEDSKRSVLTDKLEPVYCFETSDNRIWVKGIEFGDYLTGSHEQWQPHIDAMLETVNLELNGN
tara:strand:+ start:1275 stop:3689 length:2415 start_codon:yes stop_codon:yes gene_type:complete